MPKVSVIVPVYGVEQYIERCARSLFEQTLEDIEFIFVDDCTPDKSIEILKNVLEDYPQRKKQVKIERHEKNMGLPIARQSGLKVASGDYIIHCDSDDWVDVTMYEKMYNKAICEHADIAICDFCHAFEDGHQKIERGLKNPENYLSDMMYSKISWSLWNKIIRKELYEKDIVYPVENVGEDMALVLQISRYVSKVVYVRDVFYYYYFNTTSIMNTYTAEKTKERYRQMCCNVDIVESAYNHDSKLSAFKPNLNAIKLYCKVLLVPALDESNISDWNKKYKEVGFCTIINPNVRFRYKSIYLLQKLHLYSYVKKILS